MGKRLPCFLTAFCSLLGLMFSTYLGAACTPSFNFYCVNSDGTAGDASPGDGYCQTAGGVCTLHAAIEEANTYTGAYILFTDQFTINACSLPALTGGGIIINGYDQWNEGSNLPGVILESTYLCGGYNTILTINSSGNHVYGIYFLGSGDNDVGVKITGGSNNSIGHATTHHRNVFLVDGYGVENNSPQGSNTISSNYIGTTNGTTLPAAQWGTQGIRNVSSNNTLDSNLIVGQSYAGIFIYGTGNTVVDNTIGVDLYKQHALPNEYGMVLDIGSTGNDIGDNTIGGNNEYGIYVYVHADNNDIHGNNISTPWSIQDLGNGSHGIYITSADGNTIRGNQITDNAGAGIFISGSSSVAIEGNNISNNGLDGVYFAATATGVVGKSSAGVGNAIFSNSRHGIYLNGASSVTVSGNLIGQDVSGLDKGNLQNGILADNGAGSNTIGGTGGEDANWIAWNHLDGIRLSGAATMNNSVQGNIFGAPTGFGCQAPNRGNGVSLLSGTHHNTVGGSGAGNTILASSGNGVYISGSYNNSLLENRIGTDGLHNWGNAQNGVWVSAGEDNFISSNEIAYNSPLSATNDGVRVSGATAVRNRLTNNSIHHNGGKGISLLAGGNSSIQAPVITCRDRTVTGTACANCAVEIFSDSQDEGQFVESLVTADYNGDFSWTGDVQGRFITATATDTVGNTSEFSTPVAAPFPWLMFLPAMTGR